MKFISIKVTNHSLTPEEFNTVRFFLQMAHSSCKSIEDGVLFERIPVEENQWYDDMGCKATTEEFYKWKIKDICTRSLLMCRVETANENKSYALNITYH